MNVTSLKKLLKSVSEGKLPVAKALEHLQDLPFQDMGHTLVDHHRALRTGFPEVVLGQWKTSEQIVEIARAITGKGSSVLVTRLSPKQGEKLAEALPLGKYDPVSRTYALQKKGGKRKAGKPILVMTAGTSDIPVAEEAAVTAELAGCRVERLFDVGVAGLHRLLGNREKLRKAGTIIVAAGMEGALPSIVGGLVAVPVIAVPTSVGYGAGAGGIAAMLGMLNSCAPGVVVVNIDNGFGAGVAAAMIVKPVKRTN